MKTLTAYIDEENKTNKNLLIHYLFRKNAENKTGILRTLLSCLDSS